MLTSYSRSCCRQRLCAELPATAVIALLVGLSGCDSADHPPPLPGIRPETGGQSCLDSDRDGFLPPSCGGQDCDDAHAYIHPDVIDGPWTVQSRFVGSPESVRWFSLDEAGNAHWITQVTQQLLGDDAVGLRYTAADGIGFGAPVTIDNGYDVGSGTALWMHDDGPHVLHWSEPQRKLNHASEAKQWSPSLISDEATSMSQLVRLDDRWHTTFTIDYSTPLLRHAVMSDGFEGYWEITELGEGSADALFLRQSGEMQMISTAAGSCFRHGRWLAESWSFTPYEEGSACKVLATTLDNADQLHVLFRQDNSIRMASEQGGVWSALDIPTHHSLLLNDDVPAKISLMVDDAGALHIAFAERPGVAPPAEAWPLFYISNAGEIWREEVVARQTGAVLVAAPDGSPLIALSRHTLNGMAPQLGLARRSGNDGIDQNCDGIDGS